MPGRFAFWRGAPWQRQEHFGLPTRVHVLLDTFEKAHIQEMKRDEPVIWRIDPLPYFRLRTHELLGEKDAELFLFLWERFMELKHVWSELEVILDSDKPQGQLLKKHLAVFCRVATDAMWREMIIGVVAFGDPTVKNDRSTASLHALMAIPAQGPLKELKATLDLFEQVIGHLRNVRHNHIGHYSRKRIAHRTVTKVQRANVSAALDSIQSVLLAFSILHKLPMAPRHAGPVENGGSKSLLKILKAYDSLG